jgi:Family of unknown function (DUF5757)
MIFGTRQSFFEMSVKSIVYKKASMQFCIGEGVFDGNYIFDDIVMSESVIAVVRLNHGSLWYKLNKNLETDDYVKVVDRQVIRYIEKDSSGMFKDYSLDEILKDPTSLKKVDDGMIITISNIFSNKYTTAIIDFNSNVCTFDCLMSFRNQEQFVKDIITGLFKSKTNPEMLTNNITIDIFFENRYPKLDLLSDLITNNFELRKKFRLCENTMPRSLKLKYYLIISDMKNIDLHDVVLLFIRNSNLTIRASGIKKIQAVPSLLKDITSLIDEYEAYEPRLTNIYNSIFGYSSTSEISTINEIRNLRAEVPELFVTGYSRECSIKPFIIRNGSDTRAKTMRYPKYGRYSRLYTCPEGFYPGLKKNRLQNQSLFKYLPACYTTDHSLNPASNYSKYYLLDSELYNRATQVNVLLPGEKGDVPNVLKKIISTNRKEEIFRIGSYKTASSFMECVHNCLNNDIFAINMRTRLNFNPAICLQELWYMNPKEILSNIRNPEVFMDPTLYVRALESIYKVNIFVFDMIDIGGKSKLSMSVAECPPPYIWEPVSDTSILILCHRNLAEFPHCEYVKLDKPQSLKMIKYKNEFLSIIQGRIPEKPVESSYQYINACGKCTYTGTTSDTSKCFWRPLNLPLINTPDIEYTKTLTNEIKKAYFLCDVISIIKSFDIKIEDHVIRTFENIEFNPVIIKERFLNLTECVDYYHKIIPRMFNKSKIIINEFVYHKLKIYSLDFKYSRLFLKVLDKECFKNDKNAKLILRKN